MKKAQQDKKEKWLQINLLIIFVAFTIMIIVVAFQYYSAFETHNRIEQNEHLSAISDLKIGELVQWRKERQADAGVFYNNEVFTEHVLHYLKNTNNLQAKNYIQIWLNKFKTEYNYNAAFLIDTNHANRIIVSDTTEQSKSFISPVIYDSLKSGKIVFEDFYRDEAFRKIFLKVLTPILDKKNSNQLIAIVELRIDPEIYLYPLIQRWPIHSKSSETLIARREDDEVVFLNELRFQKNTALNLHFPLTEKEILVVKGALGERGILEGKDYKGDLVIGIISDVPNSPWFMIARVDESEVFATLVDEQWKIISFVIVLIVLIGSGLGFILRYQSIRSYKEKAASAQKLEIANLELIKEINERKQGEEALKIKDALLNLTGQTAKVGGWEIDTETMKQSWTSEVYIIHEVDFTFNPNIENGINFYSPISKPIIENALQRAIEFGEPFDLELEFITYKGKHIWVHSIGEAHQANGKTIKVFGSIQNITERKKAEEVLKEKINSLERFQKVTIDRELAMIKLKKEINELLKLKGKAEKYVIHE